MTLPTSLPSPSTTIAPSRTGWRPSTARPTRLRIGPSASSWAIRCQPAKPPSARRRFDKAKAEVGLDRRGVVVEIVAVERQARLEPQRIARAEADRLHLGLVGEQIGDRRRRRAPGSRFRSRPRRYSPSG